MFPVGLRVLKCSGVPAAGVHHNDAMLQNWEYFSIQYINFPAVKFT